MKTQKLLSLLILPSLTFIGTACDRTPLEKAIEENPFPFADALLSSALPQRKVFGVHDTSGLPPLASGEITRNGWLRPDRFFPRFATSLGDNGEPIVLMQEGGRVRAAGQWVLVVGKPVFSIRPDEVEDALAGFTLGIDIVDEDLYAGRAWVVARAADGWAPVADRLLPIDQMSSLRIETLLNGEVVAQQRPADLDFAYADLVSYISTTQPLAAGDLIFIGQPTANNEAFPLLHAGDRLGARIPGVLELEHPVISTVYNRKSFCLPEAPPPPPSGGIRRYLRFLHEGEIRYGRAEGENVRLLKGNLFARPEATEILLDRATLNLLPPVAPEKIFCITRNFPVEEPLGAEQLLQELPERFRIKAASSVVLTGTEILIPAEAQNLDWEAELAIVIGKEARHVSVEEAMEYVFGYIAGNDVSENDWGGLAGKSYDTWGVLGEELVRGVDWRDLQVEAWVNGKIVQSGTLRNQRYPVEVIVAFLSRHFTLRPGDMIYGGTVMRLPDSPPAFEDGDFVEVRISDVGTTRNRARRIERSPGRPDSP